MPPKPKTEETALSKVETGVKLQKMAGVVSIEDLLESGVLPPGMTKEKVLTITQYGKELGMDAMTAINSISVVSGKMVLGAACLGAMLKRKGYEFIWTKDWEVEGERIITELKIFWMSSTLKREMSQTFKMSWGELEMAGLTSRETYKKYPKFMLRNRCMSAAVRAIAPEILLGLYTDVEMADQNPDIKLNIDEDGNTQPLSTTDVEYVEIN